MSLRPLLINALAIALIAAPAVAAESSARGPHVKATLLADRAAVRPGETFTLALLLDPDPEWHIYWQYHGGSSGMPTDVRWEVPKGWTAGPPLFPVPKAKLDELGEMTYILEGRVVILGEVAVAADAPIGTAATIGARASWLVCRKECIPGNVALTMSLPVESTSRNAVEETGKLIQRARRALPLASDQAKYLRIRTEAGAGRIRPGDRFESKLILDIQKGHHIQSAKPSEAGLIVTEVFVAPPTGLIPSALKYPPGKERTVPGLGKVSEYDGTVTIGVPLEATEELPSTPIVLTGVVRYQACTDSGTCYPPLAVRFEIPYSPAAAAARASSDKSAAPTGDAPHAASPQQSSAVPAPPGQDAAVSRAPTRFKTSDNTPGTWLDRAQRFFLRFGIFGYLAMAAIGGFVLNFMPCVLPVISIKVLSFVNQAHEHRWRVILLGLSFAAGIMVSFLALGILILGLESQWGGLFQRPRVVIGLAAVVTAFALSLFGVFSLNPPRVVNELGEKARGEGAGHAFAMGLMATLLGTACTAPFLSAVVAIAVQQPRAIGMAIFLVAGFGMAFPYVLLAANPNWLRIIPRPGRWMETFERVVGFVLLATVVWLLNPLGSQIGPVGLLWTIVFLLLVAAAGWVYGRLGFDAPVARKVRACATVALLVVGGWYFCFRWVAPIDRLVAEQIELRKKLAMASWVGGDGRAPARIRVDWKDGSEIPWQTYSRQAMELAVKAGHTVFVDYTADWCVNCKANEKLVLNTAEVRQAMRDLGVIPFKADFTSEDPEITADLARYGRSGVPMYLVVPARALDRAVVLPEVLTKGLVIDALRSAGASDAKPDRVAIRRDEVRG
ncbi:MAG: thioredoxin family protein [Phycisphaerae bacterium]|nr:thioredoxin family protein [Phycisphaerae bacterium]